MEVGGVTILDIVSRLDEFGQNATIFAECRDGMFEPVSGAMVVALSESGRRKKGRESIH